MKFKPPINENYCATIVNIKNIIPIENSDFIQSTTIFGNSVIISKDTKLGDIGVYFPAETQLSHEFIYENNLYRHSQNNKDEKEKGYIEDNRRIRTMKMRGTQSCGLWMPIQALSYCISDLNQLEVGDSFDEVKGKLICNKYIVQKKNPSGIQKKKEQPKIVKFLYKIIPHWIKWRWFILFPTKKSKLINNQFRFHQDTSQLGKNIHQFSPDDIISITYKMHGTSLVSSKVLYKKALSVFYRFLKILNIDIIDFKYYNIFSSRKVIKNLTKQTHYYDVDIWELANNKIKEFLLDGMTAYAEIVGYLPNGKPIQYLKGKAYDYGCNKGEFEVYIYRITYTNMIGDVFEFSAKQIQDWCKERGLKAVPELYYGRVKDLLAPMPGNYTDVIEYWNNGDILIDFLRGKYLEKDCFMCKNKLPAEGIVVRKETHNLSAFKLKSFKFMEAETKQLDKGEENIEDIN